MPDPTVLERHRRMAAKWLRLSAGRMDRENALAQLIATVERDARAAALEEAAKVCEYNGSKAHEDEEANIEFVCRENAKSVRALLHESPPDPACACMDEENSGGAVRTETRDCPVHGNPEIASSEAFKRAARICEQTMPPGFRAMSQDWRDGYIVCQREVARAIRERGGK